VPSNPALAAWSAASVKSVLLPSGTTVRVRIPDAEQILRSDQLPSDLLAIATKFAATGVELVDLGDEQLLQFLAFSRHLALSCVRAVQQEDQSWSEVTLTSDDFDALPVEDRDALRNLALRAQTAAQVTALTQLSQKLLTPEMTAAVVAEEAGSTIEGYATFRGEREGAVPGTDGGDVRGEPGSDVPGPGGPGADRGGG
jgi:hypothetical protein